MTLPAFTLLLASLAAERRFGSNRPGTVGYVWGLGSRASSESAPADLYLGDTVGSRIGILRKGKERGGFIWG